MVPVGWDGSAHQTVPEDPGDNEDDKDRECQVVGERKLVVVGGCVVEKSQIKKFFRPI